MTEGYNERRRALEARWAPWVDRRVHEHLSIAAELWKDRPFLISDEQTLSYAKVQDEATAMAAVLRRAGVVPGDRVGALVGNTPDAYVFRFALSALGATSVFLNYLMSPPELEYVVAQSKLRLIVGREEVVGRDMRTLLTEVWHHTEQEVPTALVNTRVDAAGLDRGLRMMGALGLSGTRETGVTDYPAEIFYTSGSTGRPKGVMVTARSLLRNGYGTTYARALTERTRTLTALPTFHRFGYGEAVLPASFCGGSVVLHDRFDASEILDSIHRSDVTDIVGVSLMARSLMELPELPRGGPATLTSIYSGADSMPPWYWESLSTVLGISEITSGFGMTEHGTSFLTCPDDPPAALMSTLGRCKPAGIAGIESAGFVQTECRVVDTGSGHVVASGEEGELQYQGPCVIERYWNDEDSRAEFVDGWHRSGDLGRLDDAGFLTLTGRIKDMYKSGGENVMPREVEEAILRMPGVSEAHVVPIPDTKWGEVGVACLVASGDDHPTTAEVLAHCRAYLAPYKLPKHVLFLDWESVPRAAVGKVAKSRLVPIVKDLLASKQHLSDAVL